jgi:integrase
MKGRSGGSIYRRRESSMLWLKYYDAQGRPHRESTGTTNVQEAKRLLAIRVGAIAKGEPVAVNPHRVTVSGLLDDLVTDYTNNGQALGAIAPGVARLREAFGRWRAAEVTTAALRDYIARHQRTEMRPDGLSNGTLNRDLSALRRAYTLGVQATKVTARPYFPMLKEAPARKGFFERDQFEAVRRHLPADLQPVATFEYITGWRNESEVYPLCWSEHVSMAESVVRLNPGEAKNEEAREFPFTAELRALLEGQRAKTDALQRKLGRIIPHVFHRNGRPIRDMRRAWATACKAAGLPGRYQHDFRRTAVRNLVRAGVPERVAMQMTGHKTRAVFERYNIVSEGDMRAAAAKLDQAAATRLSPPVQRRLERL